MVKYRVLYVTLLASSLFWFIFHNDSVSFAILLICIIYPIVLKVWLIAACRTLQIKIMVRGKLHVNTPVQIQIIAVGRQPACIGRIHGNALFYHMILGQKEEKNILLLEKKDLLCADLDYQNCSCGVIAINLENLRAYDCFGITTCKITAPEMTVFLLMPDEEDNMHHSDRIVSYGDEFIGIRKYREGDHISRIHWKLSSKWDKLYVKEFSEPELPEISDNIRTKCQSCTSRKLCYNKLHMSVQTYI